MQPNDPTVATPPKLYGLKAAFVLTGVLMVAWGYYLLVQDTALRSFLDAVGRDWPAGARKLGGVLAYVAALMLPFFAVLFVLAKAGIWLDVRRHVGAATYAEAARKGAREAEALARRILEERVAQLQREGMSAADIADFRKTFEEGIAKSAASMEERAKQYEQDPALAEHDFKVAMEEIRAKQRFKGL